MFTMKKVAATAALAMTAVQVTTALPTAGVFEEVEVFSVARSPSGMFFDETTNLLYVLCGTDTNADHYIFAVNSTGATQCEITITAGDGQLMSRVDGFQIVGDVAYIADSQGPIYAEDPAVDSYGGSIYQVDWSTNPCGCADGVCTSTAVTWTPEVLSQIFVDAVSVGDGAGIDDFFRNSGIVVKDDFAFAVNGVHPVNRGDLTSYYPKSLVKVALSDTGDAAETVQQWSFDATTIGHDVDMEGLTCGEDSCENYMYIGDEYNLIYKLNLNEADPATAVEIEWDISGIVSVNVADKGIESLTYASTTGFFYAGIQETSEIYVLRLLDEGETLAPTATPEPTTESPTTESPTPEPTTGVPSASPTAGENAATSTGVATLLVAFAALLQAL